MGLGDVDLLLPVDVQHHVELLGAPVEEEDWLDEKIIERGDLESDLVLALG